MRCGPMKAMKPKRPSMKAMIRCHPQKKWACSRVTALCSAALGAAMGAPGKVRLVEGLAAPGGSGIQLPHPTQVVIAIALPIASLRWRKNPK